MDKRLRDSECTAIGALVLLASATLGSITPTDAQAQDVAGSGMGQGQASINVRSDVTLGIKGLRSTTTERLAQLTEIVTDQMPEVRKCYRTLIAKRPTTVASLEIHITLEQGNQPPAIELKENGGADDDLSGCIKRVIEHAPFRKVGRPAAAALTLQFENTRAKGEQEMAQRRAAAEQVDVRERAGGGYEGNWTAADGKVSFAVSSDSSREATDITLRALRNAAPGFADCRRRSEQGGLSPAGELAAELELQAGGKAQAKVSSSTVAHPRAVPCTERALRSLRLTGTPAHQTVQVRIRFNPSS
jgi:hypothetical protein